MTTKGLKVVINALGGLNKQGFLFWALLKLCSQKGPEVIIIGQSSLNNHSFLFFGHNLGCLARLMAKLSFQY